MSGKERDGARHVVQAAVGGSAMGGTSTNTPVREDSNREKQDSAVDVEAKKKEERRKKLEAWKKKQLERKNQPQGEDLSEASPKPKPKPKTKPKSVVASSRSTFNTRARFPVKKAMKKTNLLGDSDDEDTGIQRRAFFKPGDAESIDEVQADAQENNTEDEIDPLDAFMNELDDESAKKDVDMEDEVQKTSDIDSEEERAGSIIDNDDDEANKLLKRLQKSKSKVITVPKYDLKTLEPFPKNFLTEMESISPDEVINFRAFNNIYISNKKINPVMNFFHFGLDLENLNVITNELKFEAPTPIQSQTIPTIMSGKDVIGIGKTGSGKTMCYLLGMLKHIKQQRPLSRDETGPLGIILSPTRELAIQIHQTCETFIKDTGLSAICCTGGSELYKQINDIKRGVEIIIATPGRFIDLLTLNNGKLLKTNRITFVTLDEADRLFDLGFEPQINKIMKTIRPDKQCVLFSATFPSKLQSFAIKTLNKPVIISVGNKQIVNENIKQLAKVFDNEETKFNYLLNLLGKQTDDKTIIFCESQLQVNYINRRLIDKGHSPVAIHAGLPAHERTSNLSRFKESSESKILISTEVLSRGLDVPNVKLVILYNAAKTFAQYVHSVGRTARGNSTGTAVSLLSTSEELQAYIIFKCMVDDEIPEDVKLLASNFEKDLKSGKKKISSGFGGKGLDHLDKLRDDTEKTERKRYGEDESESKKNEGNESDDDVDDDDEEVIGPQLDITFNSEVGRGPDKGIFNAKININDLPQDVRWIATNNASLSKIIEETSTSVTYKGKFYPSGQEPKEGEEPKLYLLIEGEKEHQLMNAIETLKRTIVSGLKRATNDRSGKFSI